MTQSLAYFYKNGFYGAVTYSKIQRNGAFYTLSCFFRNK